MHKGFSDLSGCSEDKFAPSLFILYVCDAYKLDAQRTCGFFVPNKNRRSLHLVGGSVRVLLLVLIEGAS